MKGTNPRPGRHREKALCSRNHLPKVRLMDNRPPRRASTKHLALTSCQQLRKASRTEEISKASKRQVQTWDGRHHHHARQPT